MTRLCAFLFLWGCVASAQQLNITSTSLGVGTVGTPFSGSVSATGGTPPYSCSISGLPSGLSASNCTVGGTPTATFNGSVPVVVTDSATPSPSSVLRNLSLTITAAPLSILTTALPSGTIGVPYSATVAIAGGVAPYNCGFVGLPSPLTASGCSISGTPTAAFNGSVGVNVTDSATPTAGHASTTVALAINPPPMSLTTSALSGTVGTPITGAITASGGTPPYTCTISGLPSPLLASGCNISGTPTATFSGNISVTVTDSSTPAGHVSGTVGLTIQPAALVITTGSITSTVGTPINAGITASGGTPPYSCTITGLPSPLAANGCSITGIPTAPFRGNISVTLTDSASGHASASVSLTINPSALTITTSSITGTVGTPMNAGITASGGTPPYSCTITGLPGPLVASGCSITGTPTATFSGNIGVTVSDSSTGRASGNVNLTISPSALTITTSSITGTVGTPINAVITASGGVPPYTCTITGLPGPLVASGCTITGTPTATFSGNIGVTVSDSRTGHASANVSLTINPSALAITTSSITGTVGTPINAGITASGGVPPYTCTITGLPGPLVASGCSITGTPTATFSGNIGVTVSDSSTGRASGNVSLTISPSALTITTSSITGTVGTPINAGITATGGVPPYSCTITGLPGPLVASGCSITGTPTATFSGNIGVTVSDSSTGRASGNVSLTISASALTITTSSITGTVGTPINAGITASGGTPPYTCTITGLPGPLVASGCSITGTPTATFSGNISVTVTDSSTGHASGTVSLTINPSVLTITTSSITGTVGTPINAGITASGGTPPYSCTITGLPGPLVASGCGITGTPTATFSGNISVTVTDSSTGHASANVNLTINPSALTITTSAITGTVGTPMNAGITASGGVPPYSCTITGLPGPLVANGCSITGTPSATFSGNFSVTVSDSGTGHASANVSLTINPSALTITTSAITGTVGTPMNAGITATGGTPPYTCTITGLPSPLAASGCSIVGTPTATFSGNISVTVGDSSTGHASGTVSLTINPSALAITTTAITGTIGTPINASIAATGGTPPYTCAISGLPTPLLASGCSITGTPTATFSGNINVTVTDSSTGRASAIVSLTINPSALTITTSAITGTVGSPINAGITANGGTPPYTCSITGLPSPLAANGCSITGTPTATFSGNINVTVTDSSTGRASGTVGLTINPSALTITTSAITGTVGSPINAGITANGGTPPYTCTITGLPSPLAANGCSITGTPTAAFSGNISVTVTDSSTGRASATVSLTINALSVTITSTSLPGGTVGSAYSAALAAAGGTGSYSWSITSGTLPAGLALSGNQITGTPTAAGPVNFTVKATDAANSSATQALSINIRPLPVSITGTSLPSGTAGTAYSASLVAMGGTPPYTWSISGGTLPAGLALSGSEISGTPMSAGTSSFTVKATDAANSSATQSLSITIANAPVSITTASLPNGTVGTVYSQSLSASGGTGSFTWSVASGSLPGGLAIAGNQIAGTPTTPGSATFSLKATDTTGASATQSFSINIFAGLTIGACPTATATSGQPYSSSLTASGGMSPYQWAISAGQLPGGLALGAGSGQISGTPGQAGNSSFTVKLTDTGGSTATENCSIVVAGALTISGGGLPDGTQGAPYSQSLSAAGGQPPYTWSLSTGLLPAGLSLGAGGQVAGTPAASGSFPFTVALTDSAGATASQALSIHIASNLAIGGCPASPALANQSYSSTLAGSGGQPPYSWSVSGLPGGLVVNSSSGAITGTPSQATTASLALSLNDSAGSTVTKSCSMTVLQALGITTSSLPNTTLGAAVSQQLSAAGGTPPYTWSVSSGTLPGGIALSGAGALSGVATSAGSFGFTVLVSDSTGASASRSFTLQVAGGVVINGCPATSVVAGRPYSGLFTASGGQSPYTWSLASGLLPSGIRLAASGSISGTASDAGNYNYSVQATDTAGATGTQACTLAVTPPLTITTGSLPDTTSQAAYSQAVLATGGQGPYAWSILSGALPPGLSLNPTTGVISGTPTQAGAFTFTVQITDAAQSSTSKTYTINVAAGLVVPGCPADSAEVGFLYAASLTGAGGSAPYVFSISGALPSGLTFDPSANSITGTPAQAGTFPISISITDKAGAKATRNCTLTVRAGLQIVTAGLTAGSTGAPYLVTLSASGGVPPYTWATSAGALPPGLFLNAGTGQITGTPSIAGSYALTLQITDTLGAQTTKDYSISITPGLIISDCPSPAAILGQPYSATLAASGGTAPYGWSLAAGSLPAGLGLQASGLISGSPSQAGSSQFTLMVNDAASKSATRACAIQVSSATLSITGSGSLPAAVSGIAYTQTFAASGGVPPYVWSVVGGALPAGIGLDPSGVLSGTASTAGSSQFTIQVTDQTGMSVQQAVTLVVQAGTSPSVTITGLSSITAPAQQPTFGLQIASPYPAAITGTITLSFTPDPDVNVDDPAIQFATGGRTLNFTIPANSTTSQFAGPIAAIQTGTVAGTIQLTVRMQANGSDITPSPAPQVSIRVDRLAPRITSMTLSQTSGGISVQLVGYSTTRDVTQGSFHVVFANGTSADATVPMTSAAQSWFQGTASRAFGGQFSLVQPFTLSGTASSPTSVTVTLTNGQGTSAAVTGNF